LNRVFKNAGTRKKVTLSIFTGQFLLGHSFLEVMVKKNSYVNFQTKFFIGLQLLKKSNGDKK